MTPAVKERILQALESLKDETIEFLAELVQTESYNPPGDTRKIIQVIQKKAQTYPVSISCPSPDPQKPSILLSCGGEGGPSFFTTRI